MSQIDKAEYAFTPDMIASPKPLSKKLGNPGPLGLFSFASTTLILSLFNAHTRGVAAPNLVIGMAIFVGGLCQLLAGMWEFATGNTFGATAFTSYGGFWLSYATIFIPGSGVLDAYKGKDGAMNVGELQSAVGIYLMAWTVLTFILFVGTLRRNIGLITLFFCLGLTFLILAVGELAAAPSVSKAGGYLGIITAIIAYYVGLAELLVREESLFTLPLGDLRR